MDKNIKSQKKLSTSVYLRKDVLTALDDWLEKKGKETGGRFTRNSFIENVITAKVEELGLMEDEDR